MNSPEPTVFIVDDDEAVRDSVAILLECAGFRVESFDSPLAFLRSDAPSRRGCLLVDVRMPQMSGLDVQERLAQEGRAMPVIVMTGHADVPLAVRAMKAGAVNFLSKPFEEETLLAAIEEAVSRDQRRRAEAQRDESIRLRYDSLTPREREVMGLVTAGLMNKQVAWRLSLSEITVKIHRGNMMRKMQAKSLAELVRMADLLGVRQAPPDQQAARDN